MKRRADSRPPFTATDGERPRLNVCLRNEAKVEAHFGDDVREAVEDVVEKLSVCRVGDGVAFRVHMRNLGDGGFHSGKVEDDPSAGSAEAVEDRDAEKEFWGEGCRQGQGDAVKCSLKRDR